MKHLSILASVALGGAFLFSSAAFAGAVTCPGGDGVDDWPKRTVTLKNFHDGQGNATCGPAGSTAPVQGQTPPLEGTTVVDHFRDTLGLDEILKLEGEEDLEPPMTFFSGLDDTGGKFKLDGSLYESWENVFIVFKFGGVQQNPPDWISFQLDGVLGADWSVIDAQHGLSNVSLWGNETNGEPPAEVPAPAPLALFGAGLLALGLIRRRNRAKA